MSEHAEQLGAEPSSNVEALPGFGPAREPGQYLQRLLAHALRQQVSDIHLKTGAVPAVRLLGEIKAVSSLPKLGPDEMRQMADFLMDDRERRIFSEQRQVDLAQGFPGFGRLRVSVFLQRGEIAMVMRLIESRMPDPDALRLPKALEAFSELKRGMVLVTGATGSGKSTTLAALIDLINRRHAHHIITIEDPIEFLFSDKRSIISQREVGIDTRSFPESLRAALRQDPDVIFIGELRDSETIATAIKAADTGHLVLSTLHASNAQDTVSRLLSNFPPEEQPALRRALAGNLRGVISQRLLPRADGSGRIGAHEVMVVTPTLREMIADPARTGELSRVIKQGAQHGMIDFDDHLYALVQSGDITADTALDNATNLTDLRMRLDGY